ncbi:MAG: hypothetical protein NXY57DRAFT_1012713 [Lentinula lateritia]|nr:MAG: hypothetical protein NXY57DRAFT_1012713 [Lentinula lateritia]
MKSISRSGTTSNPSSRIHSRAGSVHGSPAFPREIGLPPQETEESRITAHKMPSSPSNSKAERTPSASTYTVPPFASSTLPSVFPVQIQQQQQQAKFITSQHLQTGEVSPHELPVGVQPVYFSNGHYPSDPIESPSVSSLSMHSPSMEQNLPQSLAPLTSHSSNLTSSSSTPYTSTYPFYGFPSFARSNTQMYWPGPTGSGHQTPNYGRQVHPSMIYPVEYRPTSTINGPTYNPTHFAESHLSNPSAYVPISAPVEVIQPISTKVVFGNFEGCDRNMNIGSASFTPRSSFYVGSGSKETRSSSLKKKSAQRDKKRVIPQRSAGVTMLGADAEVVDLMERFTSAKNGTGANGRWSFGRFGNEEQDLNEDEEEGVQTYNRSQQSSNSDLHLVTPSRRSLPPAYIPVGAVPVSAPAPVPPIPLSTLASLAPIHTNFPHPIPPHPSLTHLGPLSAETGPSTSPTLPMNGSGDARGGESPEDGGFNPGAFRPHGLNHGSEWVVRDFGYGFGRERKASGMGVKESFAVDQYFSGPNHSYRGTGHGRFRRGSYSYNNPYAGYGGDRGGYSPRRGGRGYGRGFRGSRRGPVHGLYGYDTDRGRENYASSPSEFRPGTYVHPSSQHYQTPFVLTPPPQFQPLPLPPTDHGLHTYIPLPRGYDNSFQPASPSVSDSDSLLRAPMPAPISRLSVALDPTVYYLLGQLEYYLSPQNLAQDFFLRQQMDSHGWVPIPLIASFNRVRQITNDESFVRDVLNMSSVVEVQGDMVRMKEGEWERFVLPDAQTSRVDSIHEFPLTPSSSESTSKVRSFVEEAVMRHVRSDNGDPELEADETDEEEEEEEEEDVVFVMGYDPA